MKDIYEITKSLDIPEKYVYKYGNNKAKIDLRYFDEIKNHKDGRMILVTAINPTKYGEGKTTVTIGLGQALNAIGKKSIINLREPSLGPVMGIKGGGTGGGKSEVLPADDINLHFTGDFHAVSMAHNLIAAVLDNTLHFKNHLKINPRKIYWHRVVDLNDRALRHTIVGLGGQTDGFPRENSFSITSASEIMAILGLFTSLDDLQERLESITIASNWDNERVTVKDLQITGALMALLKDAIHPNIVQTTEGYPAFIHIGPFANIAHGTSSVAAARMSLKLAEYTVIEAGFGADLGAEKFFNLVSRHAGYKPSFAVVVSTARALKQHGDGDLQKGLEMIQIHCENVKKFGVIPVVAINRFPEDTDEELKIMKEYCDSKGYKNAVVEPFTKGSEGCKELAEIIVSSDDNPDNYHPIYDLDSPVEKKIETIVKEIYRGKSVIYTSEAKKKLKTIKKFGMEKFPICMAKTQYSLSDNPKLYGPVKDFEVTVRDIIISSGAKFLVPIMGSISTMPGLPKKPAAMGIVLNDDLTAGGIV
jgi:formate--tetrahydrofolate ligase